MLYRHAAPYKKIVSAVLPDKIRPILKDKILALATPRRPDSKMDFDSDRPSGVNLIGYARAEMGIGESCRIAARTLASTDIPYGIINFTGTNSARMDDTTWKHKEMNEFRYNVNIFHVNAEQMVEVLTEYGPNALGGRYNIGYWHWELPEFPDNWIANTDYLNEIWAPSNFVAEAIALKSPIPVVKIPHSIQVQIAQQRDRNYYGLPNDAFLFLMMYDIKSFQERKNPQGTIQAFKKSFAPDDQSVGLVIKVNGLRDRSNSLEINVLKDEIGGYSNIHLIVDTFTRNDTYALMSVIDCYVSLHRSEGFGLGMAEAMYLGKPAVATNWSSNTDFMKFNNSCLVKCELVQLGRKYGPYESYQYWAEPDVNDASEYMKKLKEDPEYYRSIAHEGQTYIRSNYSPGVVGNLMKKRLSYIHKRLGG